MCSAPPYEFLYLGGEHRPRYFFALRHLSAQRIIGTFGVYTVLGVTRDFVVKCISTLRRVVQLYVLGRVCEWFSSIVLDVPSDPSIFPRTLKRFDSSDSSSV